jgi:phosphoribosyl 1,2-cyclic phosphodiesterase
LALCVLGSGSGGNCTVLRHSQEVMLIDAGFGPITTTRRLIQARLQLSDVRAICLTHLDRDHFRPQWMRTLLGFGIRVYLHRWERATMMRYEGAEQLEQAGLLHCFDDAAFDPLANVRVSPIRLAHDEKGTSGFHIATPRGRVGYATDLGVVPRTLLDQFADIDLLAIESNYDPQMQLGSSRPIFLKRRIMGGAGHLSNEQAFDAVCRIVERSRPGNPQHIVLLHRSRQCNCPQKVREIFESEPSIRGRLTLTEQRRRSRWLIVRPRASTPHQQLTLF